MPLKDHPELQELFEKLSAEKKAIEKKVEPLRRRYNELHAQATPLEVEMREVAKQIHLIERPRLIEIEQQLSALTAATKDARLSAVLP